MAQLTPNVSTYIALGANLGDCATTFNTALKLIAARVGKVEACSKYHKTAALNPPGATTSQPDYLNAAAKVVTKLSAQELIESLHKIENELGLDRSKKTFWGPREIDLDIISYGDELIDLPGLQIPHPRMHERDFVLLPLAEIAPKWRHPQSGKLIEDLIKNLKS